MSRFWPLLLMVTSIMTLPTVVYGSCEYSSPRITQIGSREILTCVTGNIEYRIGTKFSTPDCVNCACSEKGFVCCKFGIGDTSIEVPKGYKMVAVGCDYTFEKCKGKEEHNRNALKTTLSET